ncbi:MAG TPA: VWA domain-containing protein [Thermoanaerobaculia bacterium]|jgi:VWFA-related protein|nr:VWA domain-containing protein [Thermoanaerobaculia bacterium]
MRTRTGRRLQRFAAGLSVLALGLAPSPAAAQTFTGTTEVTVVEVPVQVVKDGEPVRGLTANDFEVYEGRKKMQLTGFEVLDLDTTTQAATPAAQIPVSARRHFLMLFDLSFSEPSALSKARSAAQEVVKTLHPTDLVAVATYSSIQGPQLILGFTPDRQQISAALNTLGLPKLVDRSRDPLRLVLNDALLASAQRPAGGGSTLGAEAREAKEAEVIDTLKSFSIVSERADRSIQQQIVRNLTAAFADLAHLMGEVEGRKYVVYLSEGFDSSLVQGRGPSAGTDSLEDSRGNAADQATDNGRILESTGGTGSDAQFGDTRSQNAVEKMLEEFRRADCQIQAVDIGGLRAGANLGFQRTNGREALFNMAKSTGGELYENFNNLSAAMGQMLRRTGVTYVLSFQPDSLKPDGTFHKLRVELKNAPRGSRVVFRPGYYAPKPYKDQSQLQRLLETANSVMGEESGSIATSVLAAPFPMSADRAYVPVVIEVNGPSLLAGKQGATLPVEVYVYAIDQNGSVQDFLTQTVGLDLTKAPPALSQNGLKFFGHVELPKGSYTLRTLVRNGATGASALRVTPVEVPAFASGEAALLPVFFPEPPGRWVMVRENPKPGQPQAAYPFMLKEQPYIPSSLPVLSPGQPAAVVLQGYNLGAGDLKAEARVLSADGKEVPGGALKLADKEGVGNGPVRVSATFQPPALQPGEYTLQVTVTDGAGKPRTSTARFAVGGAAGTRGGR